MDEKIEKISLALLKHCKKYYAESLEHAYTTDDDFLEDYKRLLKKNPNGVLEELISNVGHLLLNTNAKEVDNNIQLIATLNIAVAISEIAYQQKHEKDIGV